jgi:uncharacterized membrane protein YcaP (DUF421 family)
MFDYKEILEVSYRAIISLVTLFLITKILGKKQVSQLSLFDYVIGISIGNFAAEVTINLEAEWINGVVAVLIFGLVAYFVSIITMKSIVARRFFMGSPTIVIQNGKIIKESLKRVKLDINDLLEECRNNNVFDLNQINYALMEANGKLSILLKPEYLPLTPKDMKLNPEKNGLVANVIIDKKIMQENLKQMNKDDKWLLKELKTKKVKLEDILLCTMDINDKLTIYKQKENEEIKNILE